MATSQANAIHKIDPQKFYATKMCNDDNVLWQFKKTKNNSNFSGRQISSWTFLS
jgi:hypothetical protein